MTTEPAVGPLMIRAPGYLALCAGVLLTLLLVSVGAFLDPALDGTRDPDWMFWIWASALTALLVRAPFVGLLIADDRVVRRGWLRTWTYRAADVKSVRSRPYSGYLNRYVSESRIFRMLKVKLADGRVVEIPEVTGRIRTTKHRVAVAQTRLDRGL
ncbi:hypothetical protein ACOCJ7_19365 [Knoellia sp. CPCC 206453]|uniref:hypothetical protein n=1 Tax=Knoellia pratensis TaxID=3404796 RepID=UPI003609401C